MTIMFDQHKLNSLMATARDPSTGKPLDKISCLNTGSLGSHNMRGARLFKENADKFYVELHKNRIATIEFLPDHTQRVTVHNTDEWPTNTTAARLLSITGMGIHKHKNRLRFHPKHISNSASMFAQEHNEWPPLTSGLSFVTSVCNPWKCTNPERIDGDNKYTVNREKSKPIIANFRKLDKLAIPMLKLGAISSWEQMNSGAAHFFFDTDLVTMDAETVQRIVDVGHGEHNWRIKNLRERNHAVSPQQVIGYYKAGVRKVREHLYKREGVYDVKTTNWKELRYDAR
jgi:hypothetical protein